MIATKFPRIYRADEGSSRWYRVEGQEKRYPSVTTILDKTVPKPALVPWATKQGIEAARKQLEEYVGKSVIVSHDWITTVLKDAHKSPNEVRDTAADFGTRLHIAINYFLTGMEFRVEEDMKQSLLLFKDWWSKSGLKILEPETMIYSPKHEYAGSLDAIAKINGTNILIDFKTSKGIYDSFALQVAAYANAVQELYEITIDQCIIIQVANGKVVAKKVSDWHDRFNEFLMCKKQFDSLNVDRFCQFP